MNKETIFQQIRNLVMPEFENDTKKFISVAISPYSPIIVVEFDRKLANSESNCNIYGVHYDKRNGKYIWFREFMHYLVHSFEGLKKLYDQYLKAS